MFVNKTELVNDIQQVFFSIKLIYDLHTYIYIYIYVYIFICICTYVYISNVFVTMYYLILKNFCVYHDRERFMYNLLCNI